MTLVSQFKMFYSYLWLSSHNLIIISTQLWFLCHVSDFLSHNFYLWSDDSGFVSMGNFLHQTLIFNGGNEFPDLLPLTAHKAWLRVSAVLHVSSELQHLFPGVSNEKRASAASVFWALRLFCVASLNPSSWKSLNFFQKGTGGIFQAINHILDQADTRHLSPR